MKTIKKIISGGQTGADRGALDAAIECGCQYGGSIPAGRKTEAGPLPSHYRMDELSSSNYAVRTEKNVLDSDGTVIISHGYLTGGSALTMRCARRLGKPVLHIDLTRGSLADAAKKARSWQVENKIEVLNVAGPRESSDRRIYKSANSLVSLLLKSQGEGGDE